MTETRQGACRHCSKPLMQTKTGHRTNNRGEDEEYWVPILCDQCEKKLKDNLALQRKNALAAHR